MTDAAGGALPVCWSLLTSVSARKLKSQTQPPPTLHERILEEIKAERKLRPMSPCEVRRAKLDESKFNLSTCDRREGFWRCRGERYAACNIIQHDRFGSGSVVVWGGISLEGRTDLYRLSRSSVMVVQIREEIPQDTIRRLIKSMPRRVQACVQARGGHKIY
ncbi:hypothetical protein D4764_20G0008110 [Takifugu flavidus]|uniref:Uncharacterized protein n=1 Tax=Takifugu flavidus TaxID=433684 RepID=A0A5C6NJI8_9TELE|nr:hypothetical protein D4764_20G0008110 [Takifugu flavidus]